MRRPGWDEPDTDDPPPRCGALATWTLLLAVTVLTVFTLLGALAYWFTSGLDHIT